MKIDNKENFLHIQPKGIVNQEMRLQIKLDETVRFFTITKFNKGIVNINIKKYKQVSVTVENMDYAEDLIDVFKTEERIKIEIHKEKEKTQNIEEEEFENIVVKRSIRGNFKNPKKLIILLPSFASYVENKYAITYYSSFNQEINDNAVIVCLQDYYDAMGSYFIFDDNHNNVFEVYVKYISFLKEKYYFEEKDIIFFGPSKGAVLSILFGYKFPDSTIIASAPNLQIKKLFDEQPYMLKSYYDGYFGEFNYEEFLSVEQKMKEIIDRNQKIFYICGTKDETSNTEQILNMNATNTYNIFFDVKGHDVIKSSSGYVQHIIMDELNLYKTMSINGEVKFLTIDEEHLNMEIGIDEIKFENRSLMVQYIDFYNLDTGKKEFTFPIARMGTEHSMYQLAFPMRKKQELLNLLYARNVKFNVYVIDLNEGIKYRIKLNNNTFNLSYLNRINFKLDKFNLRRRELSLSGECDLYSFNVVFYDKENLILEKLKVECESCNFNLDRYTLEHTTVTNYSKVLIELEGKYFNISEL